MTSTFRCDDKETLVAYLYDEIDVEARRQIVSHLRSCAACASEVAALESVRQDLAAWQPPEPQLDFAIVQRPATVLRPSRWFVPAIPAWAQVAAAVLVMAVGAAIANVHVRYGNDGLNITTGWIAQAPAPAAIAQRPAPAAEDWRPALTALESDLRRELQMVRTSAAERPARSEPVAQNVETAALMRRVESLVDASEQRQRHELALRMVQFGRDFERQRRTDLISISQDLGQLRGRTNTMEGSQRQMVDILRRVSTTQVP